MRSLIVLCTIVTITLCNKHILDRKWIKFKNITDINYDKYPEKSHELIQVDEIEVEPAVNDIIQQMEDDIVQFGEHMHRYATDLENRMKRETKKRLLKMPKKPELRHQYGMLFNHHGYVMAGLQSLQLFLAIDLPKIDDILHDPPAFPNCTDWATPSPRKLQYYETMGSAYVKWTAYRELNESYKFLDESIHHKVCIQYKSKYDKLLQQIDTVKNDIIYKIEQVMPRLLPNEQALLYQKQTKIDARDREKRAIPLGLIFSGVSAIGGLIIKGFNAISNYKKSKAMAKAMRELYRSQEIDHRRLKRLEEHTSLLAKATKTAFVHIDGRLNDLDLQLDNVIDNLQDFMAKTNEQFKYTWQVTVSNRLAIKLLSSGSALYDRVLHQYLQYYINYQVTLDHFLTGLDSLGTGRLTFQVLDPDELNRFLKAIEEQLHKERSQFQLAFNHTYQYYAEPMVTFSNSHDKLLVNIPVMIRSVDQKELTLYSIETVPMPFDTETLDGKNDEYTLINNSYPYMAINDQNYIPLNEQQLRLCNRMGATYYCENSYVLRHRSEHTCESAIYYHADSWTITKHCKATFVSKHKFPPKVLDAGETMVLFNLPEPWILVCGQNKRPRQIGISTYKILNRTELCECSLTAGSFSLDETLVQCTPEIRQAADGKFSMMYAINKIIFDYLQVNNGVQLETEVLQALSELLQVKPEYDWSQITWHETTELPRNVINRKPTGVVAELEAVVDYIIEDQEKVAFQSETEYVKAQQKFEYFMKYAERWRIFEFVSALLGLLAMIALLIIYVFRSKILESIILSSAVMEEYKFVNSGNQNPIAGAKAAPLRPDRQPFTFPSMHKRFTFLPPTLPPEWEETVLEQDKQIVMLQTFITFMLILVAVLAIAYQIFKKCRYVSSLPRVCFPVYPVSNFLRGTARTDIFVEIVNLSSGQSMWAYFATCAVHPSQLRITGYPNARDMSIVKICCVRQLQIDWQNIVLCDLSRNVIKLPVCGHLSIWTTNDMDKVDTHTPYQIKVFGRVLDLIQPIEIKDDLTQGGPPDYRLY